MQPEPTFFFYDLETSGTNPRDARIMQFAGQRTTLRCEPVGEPENILIKMTDDILPDPDAIMITGVTPQATLYEGITEAEFLRYFTDTIATPGTIFVGFNSVRFDDEFMRFLHYRNFYDAYQWQWQDSRSRWDILDVVRMTRALRPKGIEWPVDSKGAPSNRLELLTGANGLAHEHAHDALSDVSATIAVARMLRNKQPKLFDYLLSMRDKRSVAALVDGGQPFVYSSGSYASEYQKTAVVQKVCDHPQRPGAFVYDLRFDPKQFENSSVEELADMWRWKKDRTEDELHLPVKTLSYNKCPAVAPLGVLDAASQERLQIDSAVIRRHATALAKLPDFALRLCKAWEIIEGGREQGQLLSVEQDVDGALYAGFFDNQDVNAMGVVRAAQPEELSNLDLPFRDTRLSALLPLYKARNFPKQLSSEEREKWEQYRAQRLLHGGEHSRMARFYKRLQDIAARSGLTQEQGYLLEELRLYAESIMPDTSGTA